MSRLTLKSAVQVAGCLMLLAMATGCSELTATVSGRVFMDGEPMKIADNERGMVVFRPVAGGPTCSGLLTPDGAFAVSTGSSSALTPGDYMVSVRVVRLVPASTAGEAPSGTPITPAVYADPLTSGLLFAIESGKNQIDIKLTSNAGPAVVPTENAASEGNKQTMDSPTEADDESREEDKEISYSDSDENHSDAD